MNTVFRFLRRPARRYHVLLFALAGLFVASSPALGVQVEVTWSASLDQIAPPEFGLPGVDPDPDTMGAMSGSFGIFDVDSAGTQSLILGGGTSVSATVSGFDPTIFPSGTYGLDRFGNYSSLGSFGVLEFVLTVGDVDDLATYSGSLETFEASADGGNARRGVVTSTDCPAPGGWCSVFISDNTAFGMGEDIAAVSYETVNASNSFETQATNFGEITYSFTVIPPPPPPGGVIPEPNSALLYAVALITAGWRVKRQRKD